MVTYGDAFNPDMLAKIIKKYKKRNNINVDNHHSLMLFINKRLL